MNNMKRGEKILQGHAVATDGKAGFLDTPVFWLLLFCLYALAAGAIRFFYDATVIGDDAESLLWSRELAWGYGVQPPLYTWLFWSVNQVIGVSVASNVVTRGLCHLAIYVATFVLALRFAPVRMAGTATLGIFLIQEISQTFLRTRTHNMLATAIAMLVVLTFLLMLERRRDRNDLLFGAVAAVGVLAKATLAILPLALVLAALMSPTTRAALRPRGLALALGAAAVLLAGPAAWLLANFDLGTASLSKFEATGDASGGLLRLAKGLLENLGPTAILVAIGAALTKPGRSVRPDEVRLILWMAAVVVTLVAAGVIVSGASEVKERWLVPVLAPVVPVLVTWLLCRGGAMRFAPSFVGGVYALVMLVLLPAYHARAPKPEMAPFAALADRLDDYGADLILAPRNVAANIWISDPQLPVRARNDLLPPDCRGTVVLVEPVPDPLRREDLVGQGGACVVTLREAHRISDLPGDTAYDLEVLSLAPPA